MDCESRQKSQTPNPVTAMATAAANSYNSSNNVMLQGGKLFPHLTITYVKASRGAYNMCVKLVRLLGAPWMILVTAMSYWHRFFFFSVANGSGNPSSSRSPTEQQLDDSIVAAAASNSNNNNNNNNNNVNRLRNPAITFENYHPILVAIACVFLALKAECVHKSLQQIIFHAFDIKSASAPAYATRRQQILRLELMLMHTLEFNLFQELPWTRAMELLPPQQQQQQQQQRNAAAYSSGNNSNATGTGAPQAEELHRLFQRLLGYVVQLPFQTKLTGTAIAECAVWFVADVLEGALTPTLAAKLTSVDGATFAAFSAHLVELIAQFDSQKFNDVPKIQAMVQALRARARVVAGGAGSGNTSGILVPGGGVALGGGSLLQQSPSIATPITSVQLNGASFPSGVNNSNNLIHSSNNYSVSGSGGVAVGGGISPPPSATKPGQRIRPRDDAQL